MENIKKWHESEFPTDEIGKEINPKATFEELKNNLTNVYDYLNVEDSIVRERCFVELSNRMNVHYDKIYYKWLGCWAYNGVNNKKINHEINREM
tara:strand:- start:253 stop:534 length:282 start_codon:yes stop_codon:yes gene_type:complete